MYVLHVTLGQDTDANVEIIVLAAVKVILHS